MNSTQRVACALFFLIVVVSPAPGAAGAQTHVPAPEEILGFHVGDDFKLASYDESIAYFRALDAASDRLELREIGRTSEGRPWFIALISSPENLANAEHYREISKRLANPVGLSDEEARALAQEGKVIVTVDGGLHASESAHAQLTIQFAYDLITEKEGSIAREILNEVILILYPSINPDGQNMVVDWYRQNLGTPYETAPMPRLYQKYIGHDNNRDAYGLNMIESRTVVRLLRHWEPQVLYTHHMTATFPSTMWLPPNGEPISPYVHPLMTRTLNLLGTAAAQAMDEKGLPGAEHMGEFYDFWYPGYIDYGNFFHNVVSMFSEVGLHTSPSPRFYSVRDFPPEHQALLPESLHASLWRGGWWRQRDSINIMLATTWSTLDMSAKFRERFLYNRYVAGRDTIRHYSESPPYAYFIPVQQRDPVAAVELLRRLAFHDVAVYRLNQDAVVDGQTHPAGTWVIPMDRANANFAAVLLDVQRYPDLRQYPGGPPDLPYDIAGWTLPYQMDVRTVATGSPLDDSVQATMVPVVGETVDWSVEGDAEPFDSVPGAGFNTHPIAAAITPPAGSVTGNGPALLLDPAQNNSFRAVNRAWGSGAHVRFRAASSGGAGSRYIVSGLSAGQVDSMVKELALQAERGPTAGETVRRPRIGLYRPWQPSMDEGWTRWLLEQYGFGFKTVYNADMRAGDLRGRYDVIVLVDLSPQQIIEGAPVGSVPPPYTGGIGREGTRALDAFVRDGGTLVCLNRSSRFAIDELHLPVRDVVRELESTDFFISGSVVEATVDTAHPIMGGMPERAKIMFMNSPVFTTEEGFHGSVLAKYATAGSPLLSGFLLGEEHMRGYAAAIDVAHGDGHVVLLGFRPQWRAQPFGTFRVLFNASLYTREIAATGMPTPDFWTY